MLARDPGGREGGGRMIIINDEDADILVSYGEHFLQLVHPGTEFYLSPDRYVAASIYRNDTVYGKRPEPKLPDADGWEG